MMIAADDDADGIVVEADTGVENAPGLVKYPKKFESNGLTAGAAGSDVVGVDGAGAGVEDAGGAGTCVETTDEWPKSPDKIEGIFVTAYPGGVVSVSDVLPASGSPDRDVKPVYTALDWCQSGFGVGD
jgi:hypothetical protein